MISISNLKLPCHFVSIVARRSAILDNTIHNLVSHGKITYHGLRTCLAGHLFLLRYLPRIFIMFYGDLSTGWAVCLGLSLHLLGQLFSPNQIKHLGEYIRSLLVRPEFAAKSRSLI
ncbi:hypothetical protein FVEG_14823 [Fusarium verticillioides 7600]|uniref:Uncharacterized protein n=1 Tax=Gibberella moniliformis (strain M3125 / FGSC 7600) TaxID=334819 RepID=W7LRB3_GIBM7|nr:hypothetical protein FVEG_14823 [Fusarium verticillioides 7600]EWG38010.1 hypothetical protein FVEG_14823 [Fusarium verticillioides 7600]